MRTKRARLAGAESAWLWCEMHDAHYFGSVLHIGSERFRSACPKCRAEAEWDGDVWARYALGILEQLGEQKMARQRKRKDGDREFFVELIDAVGQTRKIAVGNFWGGSPQDAIDRAVREYPGLFEGLETRNWSPRATVKPKAAVEA